MDCEFCRWLERHSVWLRLVLHISHTVCCLWISMCDLCVTLSTRVYFNDCISLYQ